MRTWNLDLQWIPTDVWPDENISCLRLDACMGVQSGFQIKLTRDLLYSEQSEAGDTLQE